MHDACCKRNMERESKTCHSPSKNRPGFRVEIDESLSKCYLCCFVSLPSAYTQDYMVGKTRLDLLNGKGNRYLSHAKSSQTNDLSTEQIVHCDQSFFPIHELHTPTSSASPLSSISHQPRLYDC
jgi:hypothetical protein